MPQRDINRFYHACHAHFRLDRVRQPHATGMRNGVAVESGTCPTRDEHLHRPPYTKSVCMLYATPFDTSWQHPKRCTPVSYPGCGCQQYCTARRLSTQHGRGMLLGHDEMEALDRQLKDRTEDRTEENRLAHAHADYTESYVMIHSIYTDMSLQKDVHRWPELGDHRR